ncbi:hypothetical protein LZG04_28150 [Saccharothrix sp. S26]|uniref:hypothetical protein n=1 Tax=Saccharothrix sp. S26 TaxID=2907215 RepID=UPI001F4176BE|nr:hypothetical protein [Saccharothrix sp. S26]MCE6998641.1 hypothetical protein [Saccharothrix sp. S26]
MTKLLLSVHVIAAILAVGPIAVAASLFPRFARESATGVAVFLHRTCRTYAVLGVAVPVFGVATGASLGVLGDAWLLVSVVLTAAAAGVLALSILPAQRRVLDGATGAAKRLAMTTGVFNLLWAVVVVLMIVRPGSTTGA